MKEKFETRSLTGPLRVTCKYDDGSVRVWEDDKENVIARIIRIVKQYKALGYVLTLRQLHYQFVGHDPKYVNHDTAYKKLGSILDDCRYAGVIDWDAFEDRGRTPFIPYSADDLADGLTDLKNQYRINRQDGQTRYVELWTEKDALSGILKRSTSKYHIQLVVNKGYTSSSAIYAAYERVIKHILEGRRVTILYFGDHDPSGLDMIRDVTDRLNLMLSSGSKLPPNQAFLDSVWDFLGGNVHAEELVQGGYMNARVAAAYLKVEDEETDSEKVYDLKMQYVYAMIRCYLKESGLFEVRPIGLTMEQIETYSLPPNPAKVTDPRAAAYVREFGKISWEVDALRPEVLTSIVEEHIEEVIDMDMYQEQIDKEEGDIETLKSIIIRVENDKK